MSDLICIAFDERDTADTVLNELRAMRSEHLVELEDACVVVRDEDGKVHMKQAINLVGSGAVSGGLGGAIWGALIGLLFLNPLAGMVLGAGLGAGAGALSGALVDYGINDDFIRKLGSTIKPGGSALFVLVRRVTVDKVLPQLAKYKGTVLKTSLSDADEARLRDAISDKLSIPKAA